MNGYVFTQKNVRREVFENLSKRLDADDNCRCHVFIYYDGTNISGDLRIEGHGGCSTDYKRVLQMFTEEYCKD